MKKTILFLSMFLVLLSVSNVFSQGSTGIRKFADVATMNAFTPVTAQDQAMMALVTSGSNTSTLYVYDDVTDTWISAGSALSGGPGTTIDVTVSGGVITAELNQQGATINQVLKWNGSAWVPGDVFATNVNITDSGGYFTGTEVETALQELGLAVQDIFTVATAYNSDSEAGTGGVAIGEAYEVGTNHIDGLVRGTIKIRKF